MDAVDGHGNTPDQGLDPNRWFENVELAMLLKRRPEFHATTRFGYCNGAEPVRYVRAISDRYDAYVRIARREALQQGQYAALAR